MLKKIFFFSFILNNIHGLFSDPDLQFQYIEFKKQEQQNNLLVKKVDLPEEKVSLLEEKINLPEECSICFEDLKKFGDNKIVCLTCNVQHAFHRTCLTEWYKAKYEIYLERPTCPICRSIISWSILPKLDNWGYILFLILFKY